MKTRCRWAAALLLAIGCSTGQDNGQTGSATPSCKLDCDYNAQLRVDELNRTSAPIITGAECVADSGFGGSSAGRAHCRCTTDGQAIDLLATTDSPPLCVLKRLPGGFCLMHSDEPPACELSNDAACEDICRTAQERMNADAQSKATLRSVQCGLSRGFTDCHYVLEIDGKCYTNNETDFALIDDAYDCSLSDRDIVCTSLGPAGVGGTSRSSCDAPASAGSGGSAGSAP